MLNKRKICIMRSHGTIAPYVMDDITDSLRVAGHEVLVIDMEAVGMYSQLPPEKMQALVTHTISTLQDFKPDYAFSYGCGGLIMLGDQSNPGHLFEHLKIPYLLLFYDGPLSNAPFLQTFAGSDLMHVLCWDRAYIPWLQQLGLKKVFYQPLGTNSRRFKPVATSESYDISFVGSINLDLLANGWAGDQELKAYQQQYTTLKQQQPCRAFLDTWAEMEQAIPSANQAKYNHFKQTPHYNNFLSDTITIGDQLYRQSCIEAIAETGNTIHVFGNPDWQQLTSKHLNYQKAIDYCSELAAVYCAGKINLNLTNSHLISAVNQRIFDTAACGRFLLTDYRQDLDNLFGQGSVPSFTNKEELLSQLDYYLQHNDKRRECAKHLQHLVLSKHTWDQRIEQLFSDFLI